MGTTCSNEKTKTSHKHHSNAPPFPQNEFDKSLHAKMKGLQQLSIEDSPIVIIKKKRPKPQALVTSMEDIRKVYDLGPTIIGYGHYGVVRLGVLRKDTSKRFAVKTISKQKLRNDIHLFTTELDILKSLDHPNVIKFFEAYSDSKHYHLVMEYCSGGELLEIMGDPNVTEDRKKEIIRKIILVVKYLHGKGICHRDIKPENFLFTRESSTSHELKIIDFGLSTHITVQQQQNQREQQQQQYFHNNDTFTQKEEPIPQPKQQKKQQAKQQPKKNNHENDIKGGDDSLGIGGKNVSETNNLSTICGTPLYIAPEVIEGKYDQRCDIWSIGVLIYVFLVGQMPFEGSTNEEVFTKIRQFKINFNDKQLWAPVSSQARDFLKRFLVIDPAQRITLDEALSHPWLQSSNSLLNVKNPFSNNKIVKSQKDQIMQEMIKQEVIEKMIAISTAPISFRKMAVRLLVNFLDEQETFHSKELFRKLNTENTGVLSLRELRSALKSVGAVQMMQQTVTGGATITDRLLYSTQHDSEEISVSFSEFLAALLEHKLLEEHRLRRVFTHFDVDDTDYISTINLQRFLARAGRSLSHANLISIMQSAVDPSTPVSKESERNYRITWQAFCSLLSARKVSHHAEGDGMNTRSKQENNKNSYSNIPVSNKDIIKKQKKQKKNSESIFSQSSLEDNDSDDDGQIPTNIGTPSLVPPKQKFSYDNSNNLTIALGTQSDYEVSTPLQHETLIIQESVLADDHYQLDQYIRTVRDHNSSIQQQQQQNQQLQLQQLQQQQQQQKITIFQAIQFKIPKLQDNLDETAAEIDEDPTTTASDVNASAAKTSTRWKDAYGDKNTKVNHLAIRDTKQYDQQQRL